MYWLKSETLTVHPVFMCRGPRTLQLWMDQYNKRLFSVTGAQTQSLRFIYSNKDVVLTAFQTSKNHCLGIACYLGFQMNINARFKCTSVLKAVVKYLCISFEILLLLKLAGWNTLQWAVRISANLCLSKLASLPDIWWPFVET